METSRSEEPSFFVCMVPCLGGGARGEGGWDGRSGGGGGSGERLSLLRGAVLANHACPAHLLLPISSLMVRVQAPAR